MQTQQRRDVRVPIKTSVQVRFGDHCAFERVAVKNMSLGGIGLLVEEPAHVGEVGEVLLELPDSGMDIIIPVEVVHNTISDDEGSESLIQSGLKFNFSTDEQRALVASFILEAGDSSKLPKREHISADLSLEEIKQKLFTHIDHETADAEERVKAKVEIFFDRINPLNLYEVLMVESSDPIKEIRQSYFRLAKQFHPDRYAEKISPETQRQLELIFQMITESYETLQDEKLRNEYDQQFSPGDLDTSLTLSLQADENSNSRAQDFFEKGQVELEHGKRLLALLNFQLAIHFDPDNNEYRNAYQNLKATV